VARARLAIDVVTSRLALRRIEPEELRCECIGLDAIQGAVATGRSDPPEVRVRVAARCRTAEMASAVGQEVETLYTNGPAAGGGVTKSVRAVLAMDSTSVPRAAAVPRVRRVEVRP
jgi:hypothetical protein